MGKAMAGDKEGVEVSQLHASSALFGTAAGNDKLMVLITAIGATGAAILVSILILVCIRKRVYSKLKQTPDKIAKQDAAEKEKAQVQDQYKEIRRDWSKGSGDKGSDSERNGKGLVSSSSWCEEPSTANMDISTGHMVLAYMEDHLKNKERLEQEW